MPCCVLVGDAAEILWLLMCKLQFCLRPAFCANWKRGVTVQTDPAALGKIAPLMSCMRCCPASRGEGEATYQARG